MVEAQHRASTSRITDSLEEQSLLEELIDEVKPPLPTNCRALHFLRATPFRYRPSRPGSRFRRADQKEGVFYAAEAVETAIAEMAFYRLLFFAESPNTELPANPVEFTAFSVECETSRMVDLQQAPFSSDQPKWTDLSDYTACQAFADVARAAGIEIIRFKSVRDPGGGANLALLTPAAFPEAGRASDPRQTESWKLFIRPTGVQATREFPRLGLEFPLTQFAGDRRLASLVDFPPPASAG